MSAILNTTETKTKTKTKNKDEQAYLDMLRKIRDDGDERHSRNGIVKSLFGESLKFDLRNGKFPLLTSKSVSFKNVFLELKWFMEGRTDAKWLRDRGVNIWNNNAKLFGDDDLGKIYGYQFRHAGSVDQVANTIKLLKEDPFSRRIVMSTWSPGDLNEMALPPCHGVAIQFFVNTKKELHTQMYQRSADFCLGVPYNIASYSLMTIMLANICGLKPGSLQICFGDAHVYENHFAPMETQLANEPNPFPLLQLKSDVRRSDPGEFEIDDFVLVDYSNHGRVTYPFSV